MEERLGRVGAAGVEAAKFRCRFGQARRPAGRGQGARGQQCRLQRRLQMRARGDQFLEAPAQAARPGPAALGAEQPAPEFGRLDAGQFRGEGSIGGIEDMMPFVEHVAQRHRRIVKAAAPVPVVRRLRHHQGVVGEHQIGGAGAADRVLHEAAAPMRAGGMDALPAPVGERAERGRPEQLGQPAGQVAALDVAAGADQRPAGDQAERDQRAGWASTAERGAHRVFQIEQAEVVLPALAHHGAAPAFGGVREHPGEFGVDLPLQVLGVGADPHRAMVALGPEQGGGDVAQGLAGAGAGLGEHQPRAAALLARVEGLPGRGWRRAGGGLRRGGPGGPRAAAAAPLPPIPAAGAKP